MSAGRLTERMVVTTTTPASDGQGGTTSAASTLATIWVEPMPISAAELLQAESVTSHGLYRFRARVRSDVTPAMTAQWTPRWPAGAAAKTLQILGVQPAPDRQFMVLHCAEVH